MIPVLAEPPVAIPTQIVLPQRISAQCVTSAAIDYTVPAVVLLAILKHESGGKIDVVNANMNGSSDFGPAQMNSGSWVPYFKDKYGIAPSQIMSNMCQAIRAAAYVLRYESNSTECRGQVIWCGIGRYHAPNKVSARIPYINAINTKALWMMKTGRFE